VHLALLVGWYGVLVDELLEVFIIADADELPEIQLGHLEGPRVQVYMLRVDPTVTKAC